MFKYNEILAEYNNESSDRPYSFSLCDVNSRLPIKELSGTDVQIYLIVDGVPYPVINHNHNRYMFSFEFKALIPDIEDESIITVYYYNSNYYTNSRFSRPHPYYGYTFHRIFFRKINMFQYTTLKAFYEYSKDEYFHLLFCCIVYEFDFYMEELLANEFTYNHILKMTLEKQLPNKYVNISKDVRHIIDVTLNTNHRI